MPAPVLLLLGLGAAAALVGIASTGSSKPSGDRPAPPLPPNGTPPTPNGAGGDLVSSLVPPPGFPTGSLRTFPAPQGLQLLSVVLPGFLPQMATVPSPIREIVADQLCMGQTMDPQGVLPGLTALASYLDAQGYAVNGVPSSNLLKSRANELVNGGAQTLQPFGPIISIDPPVNPDLRARFFEACLTANGPRLMQIGVVAAQGGWPQLAASCAAWLQYVGAGASPMRQPLPPVPMPPQPGTLPLPWLPPPPLSVPAPPGYPPPPQTAPPPTGNHPAGWHPADWRPPAGTGPGPMGSAPPPPFPGGFSPPGGLPLPNAFPPLPGGGIPGGLGALPPGAIPGSVPGTMPVGWPGTLPGIPPGGAPPNGPPPGAVMPIGAYIGDDGSLHYILQPGDYGAKIVAKFKKPKATSSLWIKQMIHCNPDVPWNTPESIGAGTDLTLPVSWADPRVQTPKPDDLSAEPKLRRDGPKVLTKKAAAQAALAARHKAGKKPAGKVRTAGDGLGAGQEGREKGDEYVVQEGDDLQAIVKKFGQNMLTARTLGRLNPSINLGHLEKGQTLQLPVEWNAPARGQPS